MRTLEPEFDRDGDVSQVRLSPDGQQLAFTVNGKNAGLYVGAADAEAPQKTLSSKISWRKLVGYNDWNTTNYKWSPEGRHIAYRIAAGTPGLDDRVGWVPTEKRGKLEWMAGQGFAWANQNSVLYVLDAGALSVMRHDLSKGTSRKVGDFHHHHSNIHPPALVPSPDGSKLIYTSRNMLEDATHVFISQRKSGEVVSEPLTWIPGASVHVHPFWSPKGVSVGLHLVHYGLDTTGMVLVDKLAGDGDTFYERDGLDPSATPAWTPDGNAIVFQREGDALTKLDLATRELKAMEAGGRGTPRFLPGGQLVLEGDNAIYFVD